MDTATLENVHAINFNKKHWHRLCCQLREIFADLFRSVESNNSNDDNMRESKSEQLSLIELCQVASEKCISVIEKELQYMRDDNEETQNCKESFKLILMLWKLSQIIFIKSSPAGVLLMDLQEWYKSTNNIDIMVQELFSSSAGNTANISKNENYWFAIIMAVAQGRIDTARHLLSFHPSKNASAFKAIDEQLRNIPNFSFLTHLSLFEFKAKWEYWQKKCIQVLTTEDFSVDSTGSLEIICKMLCADERTFIELKPLLNNWYYMLIAYAAYSNPTLNISELHQLIDSGMFLKAFEDGLDVFDLTIKSIFDFDIEIVIRECAQLFGNHLFTAHLLQLLYLSGKLEFNKTDNSLSMGASSSNSNSLDLIHELHLSEYARELVESDTSSLSLFQMACDYLLACKTIEPRGIQIIEDYLQRIPLTSISELDAYKVYVTAYQFGLHDLAFSIGRVMQMRALKRGMFGDALAWNCRIKDACFGNMLAEKIFDKFVKTQDMNYLDLVESVSNEILYSDTLIFLTKYREFYMLINIGSGSTGLGSSATPKANLKKASSLLFQMLETPRLVPLKYRKKIIFELRPIVYANVLNEDELSTILGLIQYLENREKFFGETVSSKQQKKQQATAMSDPDVQIEQDQMETDTSEPYVEEIDQKKWTEFLSEINKKMAESFLRD